MTCYCAYQSFQAIDLIKAIAIDGMPHCFELPKLVPAPECRLTYPEHLCSFPYSDVIVEIFHKNPLYGY